MFPWLLVMPWCRSKILDQSLSRHHACLVGTGHNKGKEKKKPFSLGNEKKNLRGKSFFIADGNIAQLFFTQEISLPSKKSYFFILKILLFVLVRYKNLMKRAKKNVSHELSPCKKKCFPLHIVEWFDCAFVNLEARAYVRLVSEPLYFSAFMSAKDKTQYKLIARPK